MNISISRDPNMTAKCGNPKCTDPNTLKAKPSARSGLIALWQLVRGRMSTHTSCWAGMFSLKIRVEGFGYVGYALMRARAGCAPFLWIFRRAPYRVLARFGSPTPTTQNDVIEGLRFLPPNPLTRGAYLFCFVPAHPNTQCNIHSCTEVGFSGPGAHMCHSLNS